VLHRRFATQVAFVIVVYVALRLVEWVLSLPTIVGPDSHGYLPGAGLRVPDNGYVGFEKVSFTGDGVIRPWTVALPYALLLTDYFRSIFQLALSIAAFLLLAFALMRVTRDRVLGWILVAITLAFSCTTVVASWDMLLNRESLSNSLTVAFLALALLSTRYRGYTLYLLVIANAVLLLITRPTLGPLVALVLVALIVGRVFEARTKRASTGAYPPATILRGILAVVLAVFALAYPAIYSVRLDASWTEWYDQTMSETQFGYVVSDYNPQAAAIIAELAKDAPACLIAELPVYTGEYVGAPWGFAAHMRADCPGFAEWYQGNWPRWYYAFMAGHPGYDARVGLSGMRLALQPWEPTKAISPLPGPLRDAMFPVEAHDGLATYDPIYFYWSVVAAFAVVAFAGSRRWAWNYTRRHSKAVALGFAVVVGCVGSIFVNLLLIPSYPLETNRINVSTTLALRLTGILLAAFATGRAIELLRRRSKAGSAAAPKASP
jgi:hypothetical protein